MPAAPAWIRGIRSAFLPLLLAALATLALSISTASAESRVALVIGNGAYAADPLTNPTRDARLMADTLSQLGFDVTFETDVGRREMRRLIADFGGRLNRAGAIGLFYYSGHGMQVDGRNYMIPVDANISREVDVRADGVEANEVLWAMREAASDRNFLILDACRNNPFEKGFKSGQKGLAPMDAPQGTLIAYAAAPGRVADQGPVGGYSPFTRVLAEQMVVAGIDSRILFDQVSVKVLRETNNDQRPYIESSAIGEFYFSGGRLAAPAFAPVARPPAPPADTAVQPAAVPPEEKTPLRATPPPKETPPEQTAPEQTAEARQEAAKAVWYKDIEKCQYLDVRQRSDCLRDANRKYRRAIDVNDQGGW